MFGIGVWVGGGVVVDYVLGVDEVVLNFCSWLVFFDCVVCVLVVVDDGDEWGFDVFK